MSIANELQRILDAKRDMADAISSKGVTVSVSIPLELFADKIREITTGGSSDTGGGTCTHFGNDVWIYVARKTVGGINLFEHQTLWLDRKWDASRNDGVPRENVITLSTKNVNEFPFSNNNYLGFKVNLGDEIKDIKLIADDRYSPSTFSIYELQTNNSEGGYVDMKPDANSWETNKTSLSKLVNDNGFVIVVNGEATEIGADGDYAITYYSPKEEKLKIKTQNSYGGFDDFAEISNGESIRVNAGEYELESRAGWGYKAELLDASNWSVIQTLNQYSSDRVTINNDVIVRVTEDN